MRHVVCCGGQVTLVFDGVILRDWHCRAGHGARRIDPARRTVWHVAHFRSDTRALVDLWQCDALGVHAGVRDTNAGFDTVGQKFLRGYQTTDANGVVRFTTIYPGWYQGRTVHIHFKIRTTPSSGRACEFTSHLYFDDALTDRVLRAEPYASKGARTVRNAQDGIFRRGGEQLILAVTQAASAYEGTFDCLVGRDQVRISVGNHAVLVEPPNGHPSTALDREFERRIDGGPVASGLGAGYDATHRHAPPSADAGEVSLGCSSPRGRRTRAVTLTISSSANRTIARPTVSVHP